MTHIAVTGAVKIKNVDKVTCLLCNTYVEPRKSCTRYYCECRIIYAVIFPERGFMSVWVRTDKKIDFDKFVRITPFRDK